MSPKFKTIKGWLTPYALSCGYIETTELGQDGPILDALNADKLIYRLSWWEGNIRRQETYRQIKVARKAFSIIKSYEMMKRRNKSI
jgi:hypothetical protein